MNVRFERFRLLSHRYSIFLLIYTFSGQFEYLCYNVTSYYNTTDKLEELIQENDETRWVRALIGGYG